MAQNPKYDNDVVNLGYLNKRLGQTEESINKNNSSISQLPKNYSIPPNPPYYKDSLLCYKNKIYKCNTTKLSGVFSWNDWTIAATDDTTLSDFINNTYELEKLEIQEQIDGKVQTYYQEMDPSNEWTTDLEKSKHIGDYWYNTTNNTQWRYNQNTTTTPITYGWGQVNVPNSVFDLIDKKKSIYTIKPTSYKIDDLWIIEDTLSDEDLPTGTEDNPIAKGDWVFSVADSDTYNKEHWIKRDEDISLSYLEQHYYTIGDIDSSFEELERNTDSKITKAKEEISLNVSQKYTTIEEHNAAINDFDEQIGAINDTITTHETNISNLNVGVGKISASVESIESKTEELSVDIDGVKENIIPTSTVSGSNIHIEDASDKKMVNFEIEGKSEQATRSGKNLFNINTATLNSCLKWADGTYSTENLSVASDFIKIEKGKSYISKYKMQIILFNENKEYIGYYNNTPGQYNSFTISTDSECNYVKVSFRSSSNNNVDFTTIGDIQLEEGTTSTEYEPYGISPSPDYPSEIESVGYENLFDGWKLGQRIDATTGEVYNSDIGAISNDYIPVDFDKNPNYYLSGLTDRLYSFVAAYDKDKNFLARTAAGAKTYFSLTTSSFNNAVTAEGDIAYLQVNINENSSLDGTIDLVNDLKTMLNVGNTAKSYIPYGKYGIGVKNTGKNLLENTGVSNTSNGVTFTVNDDKTILVNGNNDGTANSNFIINNYSLKAGTYILNGCPSGGSSTTYRLAIQKTSDWSILGLDTGSGSKQFTIDEATNIQVAIFIQKGQTISNLLFKPMIRLSSIIDDTYEPYQSASLLFQLDQPLRSLPNGVKDELVIENGRTKIIKRIGKVVLDGSDDENWTLNGSNQGYGIVINDVGGNSDGSIISGGYCDCLSETMQNNIYSGIKDNVFATIGGTVHKIYVRYNSSITSIALLKEQLNSQPIIVQYELAKPYTEKIGEVEIPSTFKGVNNITTTDELEPVMNIEYVRDTILSDYVEKQISNVVAIQERKNAEFQITNDEIKSSVSNISTDLDGTKSSLNSVEEKITSQEKTINIISKNIDGTTGDIREVTTTTGFTFNAEGMTIDDGAGYKAQHTAQGTFYKDGDSITGQYTKDGSKQKDLELFGTYSYGKNDINDTPMFVAQLYIDEKGEECFGHFLNI